MGDIQMSVASTTPFINPRCYKYQEKCWNETYGPRT